MKKFKLFAQAEEKFVKKVVLYPDDSDVLHYDEDAVDDGVMTKDLKNLFTKGMVLVCDGDDSFVVPTAYTAGAITCGTDTYTAADVD